MMYDYHKTSPFTLTYASALKNQKNWILWSGRFIKKKFIRKKNLNLNRLEQQKSFLKIKPDIVIISTPTIKHLENIKQLLN